MKFNPAEVLNPVFIYLDARIQNYGVYCCLGGVFKPQKMDDLKPI